MDGNSLQSIGPCVFHSILAAIKYLHCFLLHHHHTNKYSISPLSHHHNRQQHCRHPHCQIPMVDHVQRFVQVTGSVELLIRKLSQDYPPVEETADSTTAHSRPGTGIRMWLTCRACRGTTPLVYMSANTWHYSFVKFLDLVINSSGSGEGSRWRAFQAPKGAKDWRAPEQQQQREEEEEEEEVPDLGRRRGEWNRHFSCPHPPHRTMQFCFALDRKVAIFK